MNFVTSKDMPSLRGPNMVPSCLVYKRLLVVLKLLLVQILGRLFLTKRIELEVYKFKSQLKENIHLSTVLFQ